MKIDLETLTLEELRALAAQIDAAIAGYEARQKLKALAALSAHARDLGFSLTEILESTRMAGGRPTTGTPRYADPADPTRTWTGRGRHPRWFREALQAGKRPEDLEI